MGEAGLNTMGGVARACPLCGGMDFATWRFGLLRCEKCDLVVDEVVWRPAANEQMQEAFFGESYEPVRSFWVRLFEALNNRRTISRLPGAIGIGGATAGDWRRERLIFGVCKGPPLLSARLRSFAGDLSQGGAKHRDKNALWPS